ncbi:MAG: hypothetical protein ACXWZZ_11185 [Solirubrobacteraceae bacterium]
MTRLLWKGRSGESHLSGLSVVLDEHGGVTVAWAAVTFGSFGVSLDAAGTPGPAHAVAAGTSFATDGGGDLLLLTPTADYVVRRRHGGADQPLDQPDPFDLRSSAVATNGRGFAVVWNPTRRLRQTSGA